MKKIMYEIIYLLLVGSMTSTYSIAAIALRTEQFSIEQNEPCKTMNGIVTDQHGKPLSLQKIYFPELGKTYFTNQSGEFNVEIPYHCTDIKIECVGFQSQRIIIDENVTIRLQKDAHNQDEMIPLAMMKKEKRAEITGSFSIISGEELEKYPSGGFSGLLTGKLAGLTVLQGGGEPNNDGAGLFIRGRNTMSGNLPIFVIDGIVSPTLDLNMIDPKTVESITILKDAASTALYGFQASSGAIIITTKKGVYGKPQVSYSSDFSIQQPTVRAKPLHSWEYATLRNEALKNDNLPLEYSNAEIESYKNGENRDLYPDNNWYNEYVKKSAFMHRHNINITGGSDRIKYFINTGYIDQGSLFNIEGTHNSDPSKYMRRFNERTNLDINLLSNLDAFLNQMVIVKRTNNPPVGTDAIFDAIFKTPATEYGPLTPDGGVIVSPWNVNSVYGSLNRSGYQRFTETNINVALGLRWGLDFITKGLSLNGMMGYESRHQSGIFGNQSYARYIRNEHKPNELEFIPYGTWVDSKITLNKGSNYRYFLNFNGFLNYEHTFNKVHTIDAFVNYFAQNIIREGGGTQLLPYDYLAFSLHSKYGYNNRYFVQFDGSWMSSDQFKLDNSFGFFPTISGSWVISNEEFMKGEISNWVSYFKVKASFGKVGNDQIPGGRYMYKDDIRLGSGGYIQSLYSGALIYEGLIGNSLLQWEDSRQQNYGLSLGLFNSLTLNFDYYIHRTNHILIKDHLFPALHGIAIDRLPYENAGKVHNKGFELELLYNKDIKQDLYITAGSALSFNRNKVIEANEVDRTGSNFAYPFRITGYSIGQQFGYLIDYSNGNGFFNSEEELENSGLVYEGIQPRVGDFIYQDLNNDGIINSQDLAPIKYNTLPEISYSFNFGANYKEFDFYAHMQGVSHSSRYFNGMGVYEFYGQGTYFRHHKNAWTPEAYANGEKISYPALSTNQSSSTQANSFFILNNNYFRLKNLEIGYTLPDNICQKLHTDKIRFYLNGTNLFTFSNRKFKDLDPESNTLNQYPHYKTYNLGLNIVF